MSEVYELTDEQKTLLDDKINEWLAYSKRTDRIGSKESIYEFLVKAYENANLPSPKDVIIVKSPYSGIIVSGLLEFIFEKEEKNGTTPDQVIHNMIINGSTINDIINPLANTSLGNFDQILKQIQYESVHIVIDYLYSRLDTSLNVDIEKFKKLAWSYLRNNLLEIPRTKLSSQIDRCAYGNHDSAWIAFYKFFREELKVPNLNDIDGIAELAKNAGWYWPFDEVGVVCDFPSEIHQDDRKRFHNADGPAIGFIDGFGIYCYRNQRVNPDLINDHSKITIQMINEETNQEMRAILI